MEVNTFTAAFIDWTKIACCEEKKVTWVNPIICGTLLPLFSLHSSALPILLAVPSSAWILPIITQ